MFRRPGRHHPLRPQSHCLYPLPLHRGGIGPMSTGWAYDGASGDGSGGAPRGPPRSSGTREHACSGRIPLTHAQFAQFGVARYGVRSTEGLWWTSDASLREPGPRGSRSGNSPSVVMKPPVVVTCVVPSGAAAFACASRPSDARRNGRPSADARWWRARATLGKGMRWSAASPGWATIADCSSAGSGSSPSTARSLPWR